MQSCGAPFPEQGLAFFIRHTSWKVVWANQPGLGFQPRLACGSHSREPTGHGVFVCIVLLLLLSVRYVMQ